LTAVDETEVTVLDVKCNQTKVGVTAPKDIPVHRQEIYKRIMDEKTAEH
jgi:carbon storage regulator